MIEYGRVNLIKCIIDFFGWGIFLFEEFAPSFVQRTFLIEYIRFFKILFLKIFMNFSLRKVCTF